MKAFVQGIFSERPNCIQSSTLAMLLIFGFVLRLVSGFYSRSLVHPDEIFQYLEQAYRIVHGYGLIPWEYQYGIRNWTIPLFLAGLLKLFWFIGWTTPSFYIPAVKTVLSVISLTLPIGMFGMTRNLLGRSMAVGTFALACIWPDFVYNASKPMPGVIATYCIVCAIWLATGPRMRGRLFAAGLLAGMALVIRFVLVPFIGLLGLWYILNLKRASAAMAFGTIFSVLLLGGVLDWLTWGIPFSSFIENFRLNFVVGISSYFGVAPVYFYAIKFYDYTFGLVTLGIIGLILEWRRLLPYLISVGIGVFFLHIPEHKEYRFLFWFIPFLIIGVVIFIYSLYRKDRQWHSFPNRLAILTCGWALAVISFNTLASLHLMMSTGYSRFDKYAFLDKYGDQVRVAAKLADMNGLTGVYASHGFDWAHTTGYYGIGKDVPVYFNGLNHDIRASGLRLLAAHVSDWISTTNDAPKGWKLVDRVGRLRIFANPRPTTVQFPKDWSFHTPVPEPLMRITPSWKTRFP